jgi:hypothetical protein
MTSEQIHVNIEFINAKCNDVGFVFDNYENEFRNANVIDVVYKLINKFCTKNIHNNINQLRSVDDLILLYIGKEIDKKDTFNDLSPNKKNYTIHVVFRLLGDQKLMEELELRKALGISGYGRRKSKRVTNKKSRNKRTTNKRTNKKYYKNKNKNKNKK